MNLAKVNVEGLKVAGDPTRLNDDNFQLLLSKSISAVTGNSVSPNVLDDANDSDLNFKAAYASVILLLAEAARWNLSSETLSTSLMQEFGFNTTRCNQVVKIYALNKNKIRASLSHIGKHPPHIIDAAWEIVHCIKVSSLDQINEPQFNICLNVQACQDDSDSVAAKEVQFSCSVKELQDLVVKLKEAVKHVEKISCK